MPATCPKNHLLDKHNRVRLRKRYQSRVEHSSFGIGTLIRIVGKRCIVAFDLRPRPRYVPADELRAAPMVTKGRGTFRQPITGMLAVTNAAGETHLVDRRAKLNDLTEKFGQALRGPLKPQHNPEPSRRPPTVYCYAGSIPRKTSGTPAGVSANLPRSAYGTARQYTPAHGAKHTKIRYREDWNADGAGWSDVHDLVAGNYSSDPDSTGEALRAAGLNHEANRVADRQATVQDSVEQLQATIAGERGDSRQWTSETSRRELMQRLSKKQRKILTAYRLWLDGLTWREIARKMNEPQHVVYGWYHAIRSMVGRAATTRKTGQPRDSFEQFASKRPNV